MSVDERDVPLVTSPARTGPPQVVIHVGAHKTGTSLVQKFLRDCRSFRQEHDITFVGRSDTNTLIGWGKIPLREPELLRSRLESEARAKPANRIVLSHENSLGRPFIPGKSGLYPHAARCAEALRACTEGFDLRIVFYVRPVADFVESYYLQTIHQGASHTFEEWAADLDPAGWRWRPVVEALDAVFGADRVFVGDFLDIAEGQENLLRGFMERAGLERPPAEDLDYGPVRNASISVRGLELAMDINPLLRKDREEPHAVRTFLQKHWSNQQFDRAHPMPAELRSQVGAGDHVELAHRSRAGVAGSVRG